MNIHGEIFSAEIINKIQAMIESQPNISRRKLSQKVCQWFDWRDSNGKWKEMSCRVAMLKLHRAAVLAKEVNYSDAVEKPLQWLLLTTVEVNSFSLATEKLSWYVCRWGIEVYHRTLKSGCKIEERQLGNADRIDRLLRNGKSSVLAYHIWYLARKCGRHNFYSVTACRGVFSN